MSGYTPSRNPVHMLTEIGVFLTGFFFFFFGNNGKVEINSKSKERNGQRNYNMVKTMGSLCNYINLQL